MPIYCDTCESVIDREEERTLIDGKDFCLDCFGLSKKIEDVRGITFFLEHLNDKGWIYHFDDDPREIQVWMYPSGRDTVPPTSEQLDLIEDQVAACRKLNEVWTWSQVHKMQEEESDTFVTVWVRNDKPEMQVWVKLESGTYSWSMKKPEKFMHRWYSCEATTPQGAACTGGGATPAHYSQDDAATFVAQGELK